MSYIVHVGGVYISQLKSACILRKSGVSIVQAVGMSILRKPSECLYCASRSVYCASRVSVCIAQVEFACILRKLSSLYCASLEYMYICSASRGYIYCACRGSVCIAQGVVVYVKIN